MDEIQVEDGTPHQRLLDDSQSQHPPTKTNEDAEKEKSSIWERLCAKFCGRRKEKKTEPEEGKKICFLRKGFWGRRKESEVTEEILGRKSFGAASGLGVLILGSSIATDYFFIPEAGTKLSGWQKVLITLVDTSMFLSICVIYADTWLMVLKARTQVVKRVDCVQKIFMVVAVNSILCAGGILGLGVTEWSLSYPCFLTLFGIIIVALPIPVLVFLLCKKQARFISGDEDLVSVTIE